MRRRLLDGRKKAQKAQESDHPMPGHGRFILFGRRSLPHFDIFNATCFVRFVPLGGNLFSHAKFEISNS